MISKQRVKIYIDGSNFYHYCKDINIPSYPRFNFEEFVKFLVGNRELVEKSYYVGRIRAKGKGKKEKEMVSGQMKFFSYLNKNGWDINKGYILMSNGKYHEKGVDVKLALDIALDAVDDVYDTAILISSDTDILPAVREVRVRNKKVEYIGFTYKPSQAMIRECNKKRLLNKKDLRKFF